MWPFGGLEVYQRVSSKHGDQRKKLITWACTVTLVLLSTSAISADSVVASAACKDTLYPSACETALASAARARSPKQVFDVSVEFAMARAHSARSLAYNLTFPDRRTGPYPPTGTYDCVELLDDTLELLADVLDGERKRASRDDVQTWLSAALTNQVTCTESLQSRPPAAGEEPMQAEAERLTQFISNSLALSKAVWRHRQRPGWMGAIGGRGRKLLDEGYDFPAWVSAGDRRLLLSTPGEEMVADAVVAGDGSGTHGSIGEAVAWVSSLQGGRKVIYVKAGRYEENIRITKKQTNVMLVGEGKGKSVIVGGRNAEDGWTTYQSATVAAQGPGFIARDLTIINSSGPSKHQAVALRIGADHAVVYRCSIEGYQDTLYAHANRQFYRDSDVYGTVDFVFGNAAAVFQSCNLSPRRPSPGQKNSVTAHGRSDPNQNTGFSIQGCRVSPAGSLGGVPTYLGRPWHRFARVVVMQSYLDGAIHPAGWEPWSGSFGLSTLYYGEYANTGPGASTSGRVRWPGVHPSMTTSDASKFTVSQFISGTSWLPGTGVDFTAGL